MDKKATKSLLPWILDISSRPSEGREGLSCRKLKVKPILRNFSKSWMETLPKIKPMVHAIISLNAIVSFLSAMERSARQNFKNIMMAKEKREEKRMGEEVFRVIPEWLHIYEEYLL
jgi:hypothetical protein